MMAVVPAVGAVADVGEQMRLAAQKAQRPAGAEPAHQRQILPQLRLRAGLRISHRDIAAHHERAWMAAGLGRTPVGPVERPRGGEELQHLLQEQRLEPSIA